jgi:hypothetical protein
MIGRRRRRRRIGRRVMLRMVFGKSLGHQRDARHGAGSHRRADEECTASFIMLGHDFYPPYGWPIRMARLRMAQRLP